MLGGGAAAAPSGPAEPGAAERSSQHSGGDVEDAASSGNGAHDDGGSKETMAPTGPAWRLEDPLMCTNSIYEPFAPSPNRRASAAARLSFSTGSVFSKGDAVAKTSLDAWRKTRHVQPQWFASASVTKGLVSFVVISILQGLYFLSLAVVQQQLQKVGGGRHAVMVIPVAASLAAAIAAIFAYGWRNPSVCMLFDGVLLAVGLVAEMYCFANAEMTADTSDLEGSRVKLLLFSMSLRGLLLLACPDVGVKRFLLISTFLLGLVLMLGVETLHSSWLVALLYCGSIAPVWPKDEGQACVNLLASVLMMPTLAYDKWRHSFHSDCFPFVGLAVAALMARQFFAIYFIHLDPKLSIRLAPSVLGAVVLFPFTEAPTSDALTLVGLLGCTVLVHSFCA